jgi:hypothetical protein
MKIFSDEPAAQRDASPIEHVAPDKGIPPFLILHVADRPGSRLQAGWFARRLRDAETEATVVAIDDKSHVTINRDIGVADDPVTAAVFSFLDSRRRAPSR